MSKYSTKEQRKKYHETYYVNNREFLLEKRKQYYADNRDEHNLKSCWQAKKRKYNLTKEEIESLWLSQGKSCKICNKELPLLDKHTHIDHNHSTGKIRGILCGSCNRGLGYLKEDTNILSNAIIYLNENKE